jgi:hypothetical protein
MANSKHFSLRINSQLYQRIKEVADSEFDGNMSDTINYLIRVQLTRESLTEYLVETPHTKDEIREYCKIPVGQVDKMLSDLEEMGYITSSSVIGRKGGKKVYMSLYHSTGKEV